MNIVNTISSIYLFDAFSRIQVKKNLELFDPWSSGWKLEAVDLEVNLELFDLWSSGWKRSLVFRMEAVDLEVDKNSQASVLQNFSSSFN